ncbi:hypothetical protein H072_3092 [Dactylellina haptotyla CBS 200.50]|uniref:Uncharacterized protein n=1 Tax=Dactylellina haptotyla (strain CBS 200.50) TaxID=1284197 RepID=S8C5J7_DACHA|nr:hypothetical protein H072_3092 [Dactylellina haptotyla CBS 200.50]
MVPHVATADNSTAKASASVFLIDQLMHEFPMCTTASAEYLNRFPEEAHPRQSSRYSVTRIPRFLNPRSLLVHESKGNGALTQKKVVTSGFEGDSAGAMLSDAVKASRLGGNRLLSTTDGQA